MQDVNLKGGKDFNARQQARVAFEQEIRKRGELTKCQRSHLRIGSRREDLDMRFLFREKALFALLYCVQHGLLITVHDTMVLVTIHIDVQ